MSAARYSKSIAARNGAKLSKPSGLCSICRRRFYSKIIVKENDIVLLRKKGDDTASPILTKPLQPAGTIPTSRGTIDHSSIIGKGIRDVVTTNKNIAYRIHQPTLGEYVTISQRIVTPVYPADANLIVSLLDLHPPRELEDHTQKEPLEIFEAGTGHGSLTLHLARAIHGFNLPPPTLPSLCSSNDISTAGAEGSETSSKGPPETCSVVSDFATDQDSQAAREAYETYLSTRRAIIQSLDVSLAHSKHAQSTIRNFRHGLYMHNVNFHVGTIPSYLSFRVSSQPEPTPFLAHAILDLPAPHTYLEIVGQSLKPNGSLIIFCPSITQISTCVNVVREKRLPFVLETVLELGAGVGVGGREWDVRAVKPRAFLKTQAEAGAAPAPKVHVEGHEIEDVDAKEGGEAVAEMGDRGIAQSDEGGVSSARDSGWEMVCRPKVGGRVSGGGFLALLRRMDY